MSHITYSIFERKTLSIIVFMKTKREEKLEEKLQKLREKIKITQEELHTSKQKNRDMEKSRKIYKEKVISQIEEIKELNAALKKKTPIIFYQKQP
jgi:predicted  nucleic acid-binding Zn-ribbon protein